MPHRNKNKQPNNQRRNNRNKKRRNKPNQPSKQKKQIKPRKKKTKQISQRKKQSNHPKNQHIKSHKKNNINNDDWFKSLKVNDKLDIFDHTRPETKWKLWHIGTIINVLQNKNYKFVINYDGWSSRYDEIVEINNTNKYNKLKPLHTMTPYHNNICQWRPNSQYKECQICKRKCCTKCFAVSIYGINGLEYQCKDCLLLSQYKCIFNVIKLLYQSIFSQNSIEINIMAMITNYFIDSNMKCCNDIKPCSNTINFNTQFIKEIIQKNIITQHIEKTERGILFFCNDCKESKMKQKSNAKCRVFHDELILNGCNGCKNQICSKCEQYFECNGCKNMYCLKNECLFGSKKCIKCKRIMCHICDDKTFKCTGCESIICSDCIDIVAINRCNRCNVMFKHIVCNKCTMDMFKCFEHGIICNECIDAIKCDVCHDFIGNMIQKLYCLESSEIKQEWVMNYCFMFGNKFWKKTYSINHCKNDRKRTQNKSKLLVNYYCVFGDIEEKKVYDSERKAFRKNNKRKITKYETKIKAYFKKKND